jgi:uncharacterized protein (TIGR00255 family)
MALLGRALEELVSAREREGTGIATMIGERLDGIDAILDTVRAEAPGIVEAYRERLHQRLAELSEQLDPGRLEQEIVLFAQKSDVSEEIDRLTTHVAEVRRLLGKKGPVGRRLDFLMQEFNREANTLGSKASTVGLTNASVELKVLIEQMREQIQNIE